MKLSVICSSLSLHYYPLLFIAFSSLRFPLSFFPFWLLFHISLLYNSVSVYYKSISLSSIIHQLTINYQPSIKLFIYHLYVIDHPSICEFVYQLIFLFLICLSITSKYKGRITFIVYYEYTIQFEIF